MLLWAESFELRSTEIVGNIIVSIESSNLNIWVLHFQFQTFFITPTTFDKLQTKDVQKLKKKLRTLIKLMTLAVCRSKHSCWKKKEIFSSVVGNLQLIVWKQLDGSEGNCQSLWMSSFYRYYLLISLNRLPVKTFVRTSKISRESFPHII